MLLLLLLLLPLLLLVVALAVVVAIAAGPRGARKVAAVVQRLERFGGFRGRRLLGEWKPGPSKLSTFDMGAGWLNSFIHLRRGGGWGKRHTQHTPHPYPPPNRHRIPRKINAPSWAGPGRRRTRGEPCLLLFLLGVGRTVGGWSWIDWIEAAQ